MSIAVTAATATDNLTAVASPLRQSIHEKVRRTVVRPVSSAAAEWMTQPLDHFDAWEMRTWQMRFWVDDQYFAAAPAGLPDRVFLSMGGEGASGPPGGQQASLAKELFDTDGRGALLASIEHRYYGESLPTGGNFSTGALPHDVGVLVRSVRLGLSVVLFYRFQDIF